ncbi:MULTISPECIES: fluoride efflux transporter CrcB [unclassified Bacteroides]|jgi:CrcB protein|uniref:fluoride efflux transporter CrcB n=1 Tax=unclassified Bacteroides TaxID=2646097 RepID=UPI000E7EF269|nr:MULTISPECIES: fluoride efflux transporter CrcB [unclassified Bacteroides]RGN43381.1 fluoride efflux transporter CrcB [Bacteroides sp. OM05-12]RHR73785.1 fluoride efflux transporter CrcB [Bacteroides sp. AF16-49]
MRSLIYIFIGGGVGSVFRYLIQLAINQSVITKLPLGTFVANIIGCFLIGAFYSLSERLNLSNEIRLLFTVGFCGGFTTFSTFSTENLNLLRENLYGTFFLYTFLSVAVGIVSVFAGIWAVKSL